MLLPLAYVFYAVAVLFALFSPRTVTMNGRPLHPLLRVLIALLFFLVIGGILTLMGFIGRFLLLPIVDLF